MTPTVAQPPVRAVDAGVKPWHDKTCWSRSTRLRVEHGGQRFAFIPCLNEADDHIALLGDIARQELAGWIAG